VSARLTSLQQQQQQNARGEQLQVVSLLAMLAADACRLLTKRDSVIFDSSNMLDLNCAAAAVVLPLLRAAHFCNADVAEQIIREMRSIMTAITQDVDDMQMLEQQQQQQQAAAAAARRHKLAHSHGIVEVLVIDLAMASLGLQAVDMHCNSSAGSNSSSFVLSALGLGSWEVVLLSHASTVLPDADGRSTAEYIEQENTGFYSSFLDCCKLLMQLLPGYIAHIGSTDSSSSSSASGDAARQPAAADLPVWLEPLLLTAMQFAVQWPGGPDATLLSSSSALCAACNRALWRPQVGDNVAAADTSGDAAAVVSGTSKLTQLAGPLHQLGWSLLQLQQQQDAEQAALQLQRQYCLLLQIAVATGEQGGCSRRHLCMLCLPLEGALQRSACEGGWRAELPNASKRCCCPNIVIMHVHCKLPLTLLLVSMPRLQVCLG
jgi:hypothetical protein